MNGSKAITKATQSTVFTLDGHGLDIDCPTCRTYNVQSMLTEHETGPEPFSYTPDIAGEIDLRNGWIKNGELTHLEFLADGLTKIFLFCWEERRGHKSPPYTISKAKHAALRFVVLSSLIRPDLTGNKTYKILADELGVKSASLSKAALSFVDRFKVHFRGAASAVHRHNKSEAMKLSHKRRG